MKIYLLLAGCLLAALSGRAQYGNIGIGTATPDSTAKLDISSSTQGFLPPRMTAAQRSAIKGPAAGLTVFQTDGNPGMYYYDGNGWVSLTSGKPVTPAGLPEDYGAVSTFAGGGTSGNDSGNADGSGSAATFNRLFGLALDRAGNVYVADQNNHRIRKISAGGAVTTLAGGGGPGWNGQGYKDDTGAAAAFNYPTGVAVDATGNVFVADNSNNRIRKITPGGVVTTLAGGGGTGTNGRGKADGTGTAAAFGSPCGLCFGPNGDLFVVETTYNRVRRVTPAGVVTTFAGGGGGGNFGTGYINATGTAAAFDMPYGISSDAAGNLYVAEINNHCVRKITPAAVVSTFAGGGGPGAGGRGFLDGTGSAAAFMGTTGITTDAGGNLYVADSWNNAIRKVTPAAVVTTIAGGGRGNLDAIGAAATFNGPLGITIDPAGNLYISDFSNNKIRRVVTR